MMVCTASSAVRGEATQTVVTGVVVMSLQRRSEGVLNPCDSAAIAVFKSHGFTHGIRPRIASAHTHYESPSDCRKGRDVVASCRTDAMVRVLGNDETEASAG